MPYLKDLAISDHARLRFAQRFPDLDLSRELSTLRRVPKQARELVRRECSGPDRMAALTESGVLCIIGTGQGSPCLVTVKFMSAELRGALLRLEHAGQGGHSRRSRRRGRLRRRQMRNH